MKAWSVAHPSVLRAPHLQPALPHAADRQQALEALCSPRSPLTGNHPKGALLSLSPGPLAILGSPKWHFCKGGCHPHQQPSIRSRPHSWPPANLSSGWQTACSTGWGWTQTQGNFDLLVALVCTARIKTKARRDSDPSFLRPHLVGPQLGQ